MVQIVLMDVLHRVIITGKNVWYLIPEKNYFFMYIKGATMVVDVSMHIINHTVPVDKTIVVVDVNFDITDKIMFISTIIQDDKLIDFI